MASPTQTVVGKDTKPFDCWGFAKNPKGT